MFVEYEEPSVPYLVMSVFLKDRHFSSVFRRDAHCSPNDSILTFFPPLYQCSASSALGYLLCTLIRLTVPPGVSELSRLEELKAIIQVSSHKLDGVRAEQSQSHRRGQGGGSALFQTFLCRCSTAAVITIETRFTGTFSLYSLLSQKISRRVGD